jgi:excisionase family DNA binding protein
MRQRQQFGMRENPASDRRHGSRSAITVQPASNSIGRAPSFSVECDPITENVLPATSEPDAATNTAATVKGTETFLRQKQPAHADTAVERPLTCEEAAAFVRVHPKTVKRMARTGELPGHFRFGRWFFYASELDCWMRTELHSSRHSCR